MGRQKFGSVTGIDGVLLVNKPKGMTSHDIVHKVRKHFSLAKVGHGGTLDPNATGLLVLLIGRGTKSSQAVMDGDKTYEGILHLGIATASQDVDGEVLSETDASGITEAELLDAFVAHTGEYEQIPPMVSAIKKDGVPLYKLAREGKEVERKTRPVHIYDFEMLDYNNPQSRFRFSCSKGTYVRTFCADVGDSLKVGGHLAELIRQRSGDFHVDDAFELEDIMSWELDQLIEGVQPAPKPVPQP